MGNQRFSITPAKAVADRNLTDSQYRTLAAIGMYGDENGWCWPSQGTLAKIRGISRPLINRHIQQLVNLGYLNIYHQIDAQTGAQRSNKMQVKFDHPVTAEDTPPLTPEVTPPVTPEVTPPVTPEVTPPLTPEVTLTPQLTPNLTPQENGSLPGGNQPDAPGKKTTKEESPHQQLMRLYREALGYPIANGAAEGRAAKTILKHYTPQQAVACYRKMKADTFWTNKHLSLASVNNQLGAFVQQEQGQHTAVLSDEEIARLNKEMNGELL